MSSPNRSHVRRHPLWLAASALLVAAGVAFATGTARDWAAWALFDAQARALARTTGGPRVPAGWTFEFRGRRIRVSVAVPKREIAAARDLPSGPVFMSGGGLRAAYMRSLVRTQAGGDVVGQVASELRGWRNRYALDDDAYLEMCARAVQSIPYGTPRERVAPPAAFLADGRGVCSERSVLLAALLLHEGYDTAVWVFDTQRHVAVGVRGAGQGLDGSGYDFIETTRESWVGEMGDELAGRSAAARDPQLIRVGGERTYGADIESRVIADTLARTRVSVDALAQYRRHAESAPPGWESRFAALARMHDQTTRLAKWLESASDERETVYRMLTDSAGR